MFVAVKVTIEILTCFLLWFVNAATLDLLQDATPLQPIRAPSPGQS